MPWFRHVQVIVASKDGDASKTRVFENHRIDFEVRSIIGWASDTATITLYNLSVDEVKYLQDKSFGERRIEIRAGYSDAVGNSTTANKNTSWQGVDIGTTGSQKLNRTTAGGQALFNGVITNAVGFRRPPEHITQLFCLSLAGLGATEFKQMKAIPKGATLKQAITSMCNDYGFSTISQFGLSGDDLNVVLPLGRTFHDTFIKEFTNLLGEYNMDFTMTTSEIQIFPNTFGNKDAMDRMAKEREPVKLDPNAVIGNPIAGICTLQLDTFINTAVQPGMVLDVTPLVGKEVLANGVVAIQQNVTLFYDKSVFQYAMEDKYLIMEVVHSGSTHAVNFRTHISALTGGNTALGGNEATWQQMYASIGMSDE